MAYLNGKKILSIDGLMVEQKTLIEKTITQNGTYNASDDNADGYSKVVANIEGRQVIYGMVSISGNEVNKIILNDIPSEPQTLIFYSGQQTGAYANLYIKNKNYPNHYITSYSNTYTFSTSLPEQKIYYTYENGVLTIRNNALKYFRNNWYYILIL